MNYNYTQEQILEEITLTRDNFTGNKGREILNKFGVLVVKGVVSKYKCNKYSYMFAKELRSIYPELDYRKVDSDGVDRDGRYWKTYNMPNGPKFGMYQSVVGHFQVPWIIRKRMYHYFSELYDDDNLITSVDGVSFYPYKQRVVNGYKPWPHIDNTDPIHPDDCDIDSDGNPYPICVQGEVKLTNCTSEFMCTPFSHIPEFIDKVQRYIPANARGWFRYTTIPNYEEWLNDNLPNPNLYNMKIKVEKGSAIFWLSHTMHSSCYQIDGLVDSNLDLSTIQRYPSFDNWRFVIFVCMQRKEDVSDSVLERVKKATLEGRTTNHSVTKLFSDKPRYKRSDRITKIANNIEEYSGYEKYVKGNRLLENITCT